MAAAPPIPHFPPSTAMLSGAADLPRPKTAFTTNALTGPQAQGAGQRSPTVMSLGDPVATHLLVETALGDSKTFEVLSYEELDALKKEDAMLVTRIEGLRHKLALESKVRDAARSMNRLYHGRAGSGGDQATAEKAEQELEESSRKCEELAKELYHLEQKSRGVQTRLLRHTAGVLQAKYGNGHRPRVDLFGLPGGGPHSPDAENARNVNGTAKPANPAKERNWDKVFEYDDYGNGADGDGYPEQFAVNGNVGREQREAQLALGKRLEELNAFVREILGNVNPKSPIARLPSPVLPQDSAKVDVGIFEQLNSLTRGLDEIKEEQRALRLEKNLNSLPTSPRSPAIQQQSQQQDLILQQTEDQMTRMLSELNTKFIDVLTASSTNDKTSPLPRLDLGSSAQIKYAQDCLNSITRALKSLSMTAQRAQNPNSQPQASQYDVVLQGLWQMMRTGEQDAKARKLAEREMLKQRRTAGEDVDDSEAELSPDEEEEENEEFSLSGFSTKVQWLVAKSSFLKEKQTDLQRRMRRLRKELEEREIARREEVERLSSQIERIDDEKEQLNSDIQRARSELDERRGLHQEQGAELENSKRTVEEMQAMMAKKQTEADSLRREAGDAKKRHVDIKDRLLLAEQTIRKWEADHSVAVKERDLSKSQARDIGRQHDQTKKDLEGLEGELARLTTELTVARAELDASQGRSRGEKAAAEKTAREEAEGRVGQLLAEAERRERNLKKELENLSGQVAISKRELEGGKSQHQTERAAMEDRHAKALAERAALEDRHARALTERAALEDRHAKALNQTQARERTLRLELDSTKNLHREAQAQLKRAEDNIKSLQREAQTQLRKADDQAKMASTRSQSDAEAKAKEVSLRKELEATIREFEELTKASVESEKAREALEKTVDSLRDKVEGLEAQLSEERIIKLGGSGSRNSDGSDRAVGGVSMTSTQVLKSEFKRMMREVRMENMKALKVEQEERRKLESQLRALRRGTGTSSG